jgi:hypothetical protein
MPIACGTGILFLECAECKYCVDCAECGIIEKS